MKPARERHASSVIKRSLVVAGHATSISLEEAFWFALKDLARRRGQSIAALVSDIDDNRAGQNLSSAIRVYLLQATRDAG